MNGKLVSPNELFDEAKKQMLDGRVPSSAFDWKQIVRFWTVNIQAEVMPHALPVLGILYDCPLTKEQMLVIAIETLAQGNS